MKSILLLTAACAALTLTGCSTPQVWYQPSKSFAETQRDLAQCRAIAAGMSPTVFPNSGNTTTVIAQAGYGNQAGGAAADNAAAAQGAHNSLVDLATVLSANSRKNAFIAGLMAEKGYSLVDKNSLPPGVKGVPK
jgi:hypothetical protein